jgi:hypothetical protein
MKHMVVLCMLVHNNLWWYISITSSQRTVSSEHRLCSDLLLTVWCRFQNL